MPLPRRLLAQMDVHDGSAGVIGAPRLARHLLRRDRHVMLLGIGEHAVQRAGDDGFVAHATRSIALRACSAVLMRPVYDGGSVESACVDSLVRRSATRYCFASSMRPGIRASRFLFLLLTGRAMQTDTQPAPIFPNGLSATEAAKRLTADGFNELPQTGKRSIIRLV